MTTPTDTPRPSHASLADAANAAGDRAAALWGALEAAERAAAEAWTATRTAALAAGDHATAEYALAASRRHWRRADRVAVAAAR
jgi:hypothetical protein